MKKNQASFVMLVLTIIILNSCHIKTKDEIAQDKFLEDWKKYSADYINHWIGKKIILPKLPIVINDSTTLDYKNTFKSPIKIVTYVDGTCGVCISNLKHWKAFISSIRKQNLKCDFMFYIYSDDKDDFEKNVIKKLNFDCPWIFDSKVKFVGDNRLSDERFQTALLNDKNEVVMIGAMVERPELENLYQQIIQKMNDNKNN